jgi:hypothetical protein
MLLLLCILWVTLQLQLCSVTELSQNLLLLLLLPAAGLPDDSTLH